MPEPKYTLKKSNGGKFMFNLHAGNGQIVLTGQQYASKSGAENGIASVKTNSGKEERFERKKTSNNQHYFVLTAANKEIIGKSESYTSTGAMENGIKSVMTNGPKAAVDDQTG